MRDDPNRLYHCSWCGKNQHEVDKLLVGPCVNVCSQCIEEFARLIRAENRRAPNRKERLLRRVRELQR
jgi:ATP-dependent Clp protease ATP-binding subunit ClpX